SHKQNFDAPCLPSASCWKERSECLIQTGMRRELLQRRCSCKTSVFIEEANFVVAIEARGSVFQSQFNVRGRNRSPGELNSSNCKFLNLFRLAHDQYCYVSAGSTIQRDFHGICCF